MASIATRIAYGDALKELLQEDENIVVLDADLAGSTKSGEAKKVDPSRHFDMGIAEGNMMSVAAGLAASGKIAFASTFAMFATGRGFEQIRNSIGYPRLNVKVCASHAGISVGEDGASHQCIEIDVKVKCIEQGTTQAAVAEQIDTTKSYVNRVIKKPNGVVNNTFVQMMEALGYDIELHYVKREE